MPIRDYFRALYLAWGPQYWWPAESPFEIVVGAFLTQNTAWANVERAFTNLREADALSIHGIRWLPLEQLEQLIRPAGYFRQKAARLKTFVAYLDAHHDGDLGKMFAVPTERLRNELLGLNGVGPETADAILLYAGQHEVFVVDAYTRRIFERHALVLPNARYEEIRAMVEADFRAAALSPDPLEPGPSPAIEAPKRLIPRVHPASAMSQTPRSELARRFNEFHGLIVQTGKHHCLKRAPKCEGCPLQPFLPQV